MKSILITPYYAVTEPWQCRVTDRLANELAGSLRNVDLDTVAPDSNYLLRALCRTTSPRLTIVVGFSRYAGHDTQEGNPHVIVRSDCGNAVLRVANGVAGPLAGHLNRGLRLGHIEGAGIVYEAHSAEDVKLPRTQAAIAILLGHYTNHADCTAVNNYSAQLFAGIAGVVKYSFYATTG